MGAKENHLSEKQARLRAIENQIKRLQRRIDSLDHRSNRVGWLRVAIFFTGALLSTLAYFLVGWWLFLVGVAITLTIFSIVAYVHGRINRSITRHKILKQIKSTQVARIKLDWDAIPPARSSEPQRDHPFGADLDITGKRSLHQLINTAISSEGSQRLQDWLVNYPTPGRRGLVSVLHRNSAYRSRGAALVSSHDTSGRIDKTPVLIQSCRTSSVLSAMLRAPTKSAWRV